MTEAPVRILFLCTGNSCRSQMAEGLARQLRAGRVEASSAGTAPKGVDPRAVKAMAEIGIDIGGQGSKSLDDIDLDALDFVVTVCADADENCPVVPGGPVVHHRGFDDPPRLAVGAADEEQAMAHYRRVRDEIRAFVETLPGSLLR